MKITNKLNLPYGLVKAVSPEPHNKPGEISATTLIQGTKQVILTQRHWAELEDDVSERIWAVFGTAVHALLETEGETDFTEIDLRQKVSNITVTGRLDNYDMATGTICDYKNTSVYKIKASWQKGSDGKPYGFPEWRMQGLIYAWLLQKNGLPATKCRFIALLKDHSKTEAERDHLYPQSPVYVYEFKVTKEALEEIESFIRKKVFQYELFTSSEDNMIPECSAEERWQKKDVYAVKKEGRKSAVKLFDTKEEADEKIAELGKGHYLEVRKGESMKCKNYCLCSAFCNFYQENQNLVSNEGADDVSKAA